MVVVLFLFLVASAASYKPVPPQKQCGENEYPVTCKTVCPPQSCDIAYTEYSCDRNPKCISGCDCIKDHLRDKKSKCILNEKCPGQPTQTEEPPTTTTEPPIKTSGSSASASSFSSSSSSASSSSSYSSASSYSFSNQTGAPNMKCGENEYRVRCKTICPPQDCEISYTDYACDPKPKCIPGCDCIKNYLRDKNKKCILNDNCPPPPFSGGIGSNSQPSQPQPPKKPSRPSSSAGVKGKPVNNQSGSSATASSFSSSSSSSSSSKSSSSSSSFSYSCTKGKGGDGPVNDCTYDRCTPTCSIPFPQNCPQDSNPCKCPAGTIISEQGGKCVQRQECEKYANCKGDYNASYSDCPIACPSTCAKPDAEYCNTQCGKLGCECNIGYLLSEKNGTCIKPEDCPGGNACKTNQTFVGCLIKCPNSYCPVDDSRAILICDPTYPCPSGCGCQSNYLRNNKKEDKCILASECPPVNCTRPNEKWNPCPEPCFSDYCSERNRVTTPGSCQSYGRGCKPQCICKQGFYRNGTDICVTAEECPKNS